jgi:hypothetical protein
VEQVKRRPSSIGPVVWYQWLPLAHVQAEFGDTAGAAQSLKGFVRDAGEYVSQFAVDDPRRQLLVHAEQGTTASVELIDSAPQAALTDAMAVVDRVEQVKIAAGDLSSVFLRVNMMDADLGTATQAAIRLGRYPQAEALGRRWLAVPADPSSEKGSQVDPSSARTAIANAIAMQGRLDEANRFLQPALAYYQHEQEAGAHGTVFRHDYAYALYVSALTFTSDADQAKREAALNEADTQIAGAPAEARDMADMREVASLIAAARTAKHG